MTAIDGFWFQVGRISADLLFAGGILGVFFLLMAVILVASEIEWWYRKRK